MLTKFEFRNFKRFESATVELGQPVVLAGPNNMGKTTALQALTLWDIGLRTWLAKRGPEKEEPEKRPGVAINRTDLIALPVPSAKLLWKDLHVREGSRREGKSTTENVCIEIEVSGIASGKEWKCGLEFDYANEESFYCRPLRIGNGKESRRMPVTDEAARQRIVYLPPMSGLADREFVKQAGEISVLIGQGQTAQVLRNLCYNLYISEKEKWEELVMKMESLFGVKLQFPKLAPARSEISLSYRDPDGEELDVSCSGRGLQQALLLLVYLYGNPGSVLLLDEPDAHLEILRQRQIFNLLTDVAGAQGSQIIAASHSEVVLNEAASRGKVIAFVGRPHAINDRGSQVLKALTEIGFDQYCLAEQRGWVIYLEDTTDLDVLKAFAGTLGHEAYQHLDTPFFHAVTTNLPQRARDHFYGLREGKNDLVGVAIFDRLDKQLQSVGELVELMWNRREIENYFCREDVLLAYARADQPEDLFGLAERDRRVNVMRESIREVSQALVTLGKPDPWSPDIKSSDEFLDPLFREFSKKLGVPLVLRKNEYWKLVKYVPKEAVDFEVREKLDAVVRVALQAHPAR